MRVTLKGEELKNSSQVPKTLPFQALGDFQSAMQYQTSWFHLGFSLYNIDEVGESASSGSLYRFYFGYLRLNLLD